MKTFAAIAAVAGALVLAPVAAADDYDPFLQENFPCQEDEVLGFSPLFGPDRVGCIHADMIVPLGVPFDPSWTVAGEPPGSHPPGQNPLTVPYE